MFTSKDRKPDDRVGGLAIIVSTQKNADAGFTLLETLISLAILSVVSLALMQSTGALMHVANRAVFAGDRALEDTISRQIYKQSIGEFVPAWKEQKQSIFKGNATNFSGLSASAPVMVGRGVQLFSMTLLTSHTGRVTLEVSAGDEKWELANFDVEIASFSYLGADQNWYEQWPPQEPPSTGFFDDTRYLKIPQLPIAIRLRGRGQKENIDWIATIYGMRDVPYREKV